MAWFKVFADGSEIDIICTGSTTEAIEIARARHGEAVYTARMY